MSDVVPEYTKRERARLKRLSIRLRTLIEDIEDLSEIVQLRHENAQRKRAAILARSNESVSFQGLVPNRRRLTF